MGESLRLLTHTFTSFILSLEYFKGRAAPAKPPAGSTTLPSCCNDLVATAGVRASFPPSKRRRVASTIAGSLSIALPLAGLPWLAESVRQVAISHILLLRLCFTDSHNCLVVCLKDIYIKVSNVVLYTSCYYNYLSYLFVRVLISLSSSFKLK